MGNNILYLLIKNKLRKYIRIFNKNKLKYIIYLLLSIFLISFIVDFIRLGIKYYFSFFTLTIYIYCLMKIFQDAPIMNIDYQFFEFKILKLWQFKILIILKSTILSILTLIFIVIFKNTFTSFQLNQLIILALINILVNIICFLKTQTHHKDILVIATIFLVSLIYYLNLKILLTIIVFIIFYKFISMQFIKYDEIVPYYYSMAYLFQGLSENNLDTISIGQSKFIKSKIKNSPNLIEKYYDSNLGFEFYKEISRAMCNYKKIINISLINFIITSLLLIYKHPLWLNGVAMFVIIFMIDTILTYINKSEYVNMNKGFFIPYTIKDILIKKYFSHLCIIAIPFISSIFIIKYINFFTFILCILIVPIKNILYNFSKTFSTKLISYVLESLILFLICINC